GWHLVGAAAGRGGRPRGDVPSSSAGDVLRVARVVAEGARAGDRDARPVPGLRRGVASGLGTAAQNVDEVPAIRVVAFAGQRRAGAGQGAQGAHAQGALQDATTIHVRHFSLLLPKRRRTTLLRSRPRPLAGKTYGEGRVSAGFSDSL